MKTRAALRSVLIIAVLAGLGAYFGLRSVEWSPRSAPMTLAQEAVMAGPIPEERAAAPADLGPVGTPEERAALAAMLRSRFTRKAVRPDEAILVFKDEAALRAFLGRSGAAGVLVQGKIDAALAARVNIRDYDAFVRELAGNAGDYASVSSNFFVETPTPIPEERAERLMIGVGPNLLATLGVTTDNSTWGSGVTIAVLDGGAVPDNTFGNRLQYLDVGYGANGLGSDGAHGTSVAAIAAGYAADARGVAPSASLLSVRVTNSDGKSDTFSLAQGIYAAVDAGAQIINISLGGYGTTSLLGDAVDYALAADVAVVAASGNDQAAQLVWPAAYAGVVSVGATDATGAQAIFSNSGEGLLLTAPGVGIQTAGTHGERTSFSGTSASAPVVSGAIAAVMSQAPGLSPLEAADLLIDYANEAGVEGADPAYGVGTINLGWAMARADSTRMDPAIAGIGYDATERVLSIVVQNRGAQTLSGLKLQVVFEGDTQIVDLPALASRATTTVRVPAKSARVANGGTAEVVAQLIVPAGVIDRDTSNNRRAGTVTR